MSHSTKQSPADLIRPEILAISSYHVPSAQGLIKLDAMENPYRLPLSLREELGRRLAEALINRYPAPSYSGLKKAIRSKLGVPEGFDVLLGNGSDELITLILVATARPGACVLAPVPSFVMYEMSTRFAGSRFVGVPLASDFSLDLPAMLSAIDQHQPAVVFLAYPNNPTGNCFSSEAIEAILQRAPGLVVLDEAYQPFALDTWMPALARWPNLVVMRTLSKLGLAGLRLGYMAAATHWITEFDKVRPPYNVGVLNEIAAEFALDHLDVLDAQAAQLRQARASLAKALRMLPVLQVFDSRANFILVRVVDGAGTHARLRECGILVKDVGRMHPLLENCLRLTVGTPAENTALLDALRLVLPEPTRPDSRSK